MNTELSPLITPVPGFVLLQAIEETETTSPFIISDSGKQPNQSRKARVLAVGQTKPKENEGYLEAPCKVGDIIMHRQWTNDGFELDGQFLKLVEFKDCLGIVNTKE